MTPKQKLIQFMKDKGLEVPDDVYVRRTRAGHWQISEGAWSSYFDSYENPWFEVGMYRSMYELSKCPKIDLAYNEHAWAYEMDCGCSGMCEGLKAGRKKFKY